jgi:hypothetical protein
MGEGHGVSRGDAALVNRFVSAATKGSLVEEVIASPEQYVHALSKLAVPMALALLIVARV